MFDLIPLTLRQANAFIVDKHRHHGVTQGYKFAIGLKDLCGNLRGVVTVGRPVNRNLDDGLSAEVTRLCTDGLPNACSKLYAAAWKTAKNMGYVRLYTYILDSESGGSLKAAGWKLEADTRGESWDTPSRPRDDKHPTCKKQRWVVSAEKPPVEANENVCRMSEGAKFTHKVRVARSEAKIRTAIKRLQNENKRVSKKAVAGIVGISREQLSRRYNHLFA